MLALVQRCLGHCQPARSCFLKRQGPVPYNSLTGDQRLFSKSTITLAITLFSDGAFPLIFPGGLLTREID